MEAIKVHKEIVDQYKKYLTSFMRIRDERIEEEVSKAMKSGFFMPEPLIQFNPSFRKGPVFSELKGNIHPLLTEIFGNYRLYQHQAEAIELGCGRNSFIVTSGTGSGKSLTYLASVFNHILNNPGTKGVKAILVYPMNALINSQEDEIGKFEIQFLKKHLPPGVSFNEGGKSVKDCLSELRNLSTKTFPASYSRYTGQERAEDKERIKSENPDIILTNYMMLELIMTRSGESWLRKAMQESLEFLVFDELHTYRGRQGADVSMLIRRIRNLCNRDLLCIGTSATMASSGSPDERKKVIAGVAEQIFSIPFRPDQIIGEKLDTCTNFAGKLPDKDQLSESIGNPIPENGSPESFSSFPLSVWLENRIALKRPESGEPEREEPQTLAAISEALSNDSGVNADKCTDAILELLKWTEKLNEEGAKETPRRSWLPFKFHQFIGQAGSVYVTLDSREKRKITLDNEKYIMEGDEQKDLFPVLFSRTSGYDFLCVSIQGDKFVPRNADEVPEKIVKADLKGDREEGIPKRNLQKEDFPAGYLVLPLGEEELWEEEDWKNLPESWLNRKKDAVDNFYLHRLPRKVTFDTDGNFSEGAKYPLSGWFIPARMLFDPTSGVIFDTRTNENTKLMRLGNEGRSSATTIISLNTIQALSKQGQPSKNQKLLSFTDNRQDASLQAGHFNDFLITSRLRSGIIKALEFAPDGKLEVDTISSKVLQALGLGESEYARNPSENPDWPDSENEKAIKDYLLLRVFYDLKRGWRYTIPNLEQCGLLEISYDRLEEYSQKDEFFQNLHLLKDLDPAQRFEVFRQILNYFRTAYAIDHPKLVEGLDDFKDKMVNRLDSTKLWSLDTDEKVDSPYILLPEPVGQPPFRVYVASIGPLSYVGKYLKRKMKLANADVLKGKALGDLISETCEILAKGNFLKRIQVKGSLGTKTGYRLRTDKVIWKKGDGSIIPDEIRNLSYKELDRSPNEYFREFYINDLSRIKEAREHSGQISTQQRIDREKDFREGKISALYCSPTMELGIDISELSVVHMRNVPPNPANYAQRSGRAGRSGQAALVFTYCSNGSPHDRNYFRDRVKMVAGAVNPPKLDLANEELVAAHLNALILMDVGIKELRESAADVLDMSDTKNLPVSREIELHIREHLKRFSGQLLQKFKELAASIPGIQNSAWFTDEWLSVRISGFFENFSKAFNRWRILYQRAEEQIAQARMIIDNPIIKKDSEQYREADRREKFNKRKRELLQGKEAKNYGSESEFYVFRYLAAEGFLPGYNFTRLPVRAFLGYRHADKGEFISRARFVALKEFGPNNLIYHNGGKFRISKMQIGDAENKLQKLIVSTKTGYALLNEERDFITNDPITGDELKGENVQHVANLLELQETEARPVERISSEEEERTGTGFDIQAYFSFSKGIEQTQQAVLLAGEAPLLRIIHDKSARMVQVNHKWKISKEKAEEAGFYIGKNSGKWKRAYEIVNPSPDDPEQLVRLFTTETADILYLQPIPALGLESNGIITLAFALKRAIEKQFQAEENEIGVWVLGEQDHQNILLFEDAEGSLGILSQMVQAGPVLNQTFREAYRLLHFDPETKSDTRPDLPSASYNDLLSYYNQRYHNLLDRHSVKEALEKLMICTLDNQQGGKTRQEQYEFLLENYDRNSELELKLLRFLMENGYQLPDRAQVNIPGCYVNADFVYKRGGRYSLIFCDGTVHDSPEQKKQDMAKRKCCRDAGHDVVEWHYSEKPEALVERRKDIFRKVR